MPEPADTFALLLDRMRERARADADRRVNAGMRRVSRTRLRAEGRYTLARVFDALFGPDASNHALDAYAQEYNRHFDARKAELRRLRDAYRAQQEARS